jgi:hypothetical protein
MKPIKNKTYPNLIFVDRSRRRLTHCYKCGRSIDGTGTVLMHAECWAGSSTEIRDQAARDFRYARLHGYDSVIKGCGGLSDETD